MKALILYQPPRRWISTLTCGDGRSPRSARREDIRRADRYDGHDLPRLVGRRVVPGLASHAGAAEKPAAGLGSMAADRGGATLIGRVEDAGTGHCPGCLARLRRQPLLPGRRSPETVNLSAGERVRGALHIQTVNSRHSQLPATLPRHRHQVSRQLPALVPSHRTRRPTDPESMLGRSHGEAMHTVRELSLDLIPTALNIDLCDPTL